MYTALVLTATVIIILTLLSALRKAGLVWNHLIFLLVLLVIGGFFGARLGYLLLYPPQGKDFFSQLLDPRFRHFTLQGAAAVDFLILWMSSKRLGFQGLALLSQCVPGLAIGLIAARLGCVANGCCYGKTTTVPWGIPMEKGSLAYLHYVQSHPLGLMKGLPHIHFTQGYEIAALLIALCFALWLGKWLPRSTSLPFLGFVTFWLTGRLLVFFFRAYPYQSTASQWLRGPGFLGLSLLFFTFWLVREIHSLKSGQTDIGPQNTQTQRQ